MFPLRALSFADRTLVEITHGDRVQAFAQEADPCFLVQFYSFERERLDEVFEYVRASRSSGDPSEIVERDPAFLGLEVVCDSDRHEAWGIRTAHGDFCPPDLVQVRE